MSGATVKLPFSWQRSMDRIPLNLGDLPDDPLFPYGYGLSCPGRETDFRRISTFGPSVR
jgi:hypothetical protein